MSDWKRDLQSFFEDKNRKTVREQHLEQRKLEAARFLEKIALPAFEVIKKELEKHSRAVKVSSDKEFASLRVRHNGFEEYRCDLRVRIGPQAALPYAVHYFVDKRTGRRRSGEVNLRQGNQIYTIQELFKIDIILFVVNDYKSHIV